MLGDVIFFVKIRFIFIEKNKKIKGDFVVKDFPLFPIEKILKKAGKEVGADRVSVSAVKELKSILLEEASKLGMEAIMMARHAKRVTVKREDIRLAAR